MMFDGITHVIGERMAAFVAAACLIQEFRLATAAVCAFAADPEAGRFRKAQQASGDRLGFPVFPTQWKDPFTGNIFGYRESGYFPETMVMCWHY
jgi:glutamyl-tRNA synthetase